MDTATYPSGAVVSYVTKATIPVKLNMTEQGELTLKYGITIAPMAVVLDPEGNVLGRVDGFRSPDKFVKDLRAFTGANYDLKRAEQVLAKNPADAAAHMKAGAALIELGRKDDAAAHYGEVIELDPKADSASDARLALAGLLMDRREYAKAATLLGEEIAADPDGKRANAPETRFRLATLQEKMGKPNAAIATLQKVMATFPKTIWAQRAELALKRLQPDPAGEKKDGAEK